MNPAAHEDAQARDAQEGPDDGPPEAQVGMAGSPATRRFAKGQSGQDGPKNAQDDADNSLHGIPRVREEVPRQTPYSRVEDSLRPA